MRLSWALVHSKRPEDVQRGIAMLEGKSQRGDTTSFPPHGQFPSFFAFLVCEANFLKFMSFRVVSFLPQTVPISFSCSPYFLPCFVICLLLGRCKFKEHWVIYLPLIYLCVLYLLAIKLLLFFFHLLFTMYFMTYQDYHLQLLWVSAVVHCNRGKSFIFWLLVTTEVGTILEAGRLWTVVWRYILMFWLEVLLQLLWSSSVNVWIFTIKSED